MLGILAAGSLAGAFPPNEQFMVREPGQPALSVYHLPGPGPAVLYIHGATFPAELSIGYRMDGRSWADDLQERGFDVWSFDFAGYGRSERPATMNANAASGYIPGRAPEVARQIERIVRHIRQSNDRGRVAIIAHSWGTIPAGLFATTHGDWIEKLVLFGPVAQRQSTAEMPMSAVRLVSADDQWKSFQSGLPAGHASPVPRDRFDPWAKAYLATDPISSERTPSAVEVPAGPDADFADAWSGHFPYDPSKIDVRTMIVRGEWDAITRDADVAWLIKAMREVPGGVLDIKLPGGAHRMHLEENRQMLFDAVAKFLGETAR
jgi:pimeloyl-ACP methyl ester carboxylesterase